MRTLWSLASGCLLLSGCGSTPPHHEPPTSPALTAAGPQASPIYFDPASACAGSGGKYLGDLKCQLSDGSVAEIRSGADTVSARETAILVAPGTPQAWVLATTAITFELNHNNHNTLAGTAATPDAMQGGRNLLWKWWNVENRDDLLKTLKWLQFSGHRAEFDELGRQVIALDDAQYLKAEAWLQTDAEKLHRLQMARHYYRELGSKSILGWDLMRYISLCRWGYLAGYLSEAEAWDHMMPAALRLQQTFASWSDLQSNYLIGREFWSMGQTQNTGSAFRAIYNRFLDDDASAWNVNHWNMDLHVPVPLSIVGSSALQQVPP